MNAIITESTFNRYQRTDLVQTDVARYRVVRCNNGHVEITRRVIPTATYNCRTIAKYWRSIRPGTPEFTKVLAATETATRPDHSVVIV